MAPRSVEEEPEEETESREEYDEFSKSLTDFAEQRGYANIACPTTTVLSMHTNTFRSRINVDFNVRVAGKEIDLYKLYKIVTSRGGYDAISGEKLAWRRIGGDFHLGSQNAAAYAFALKTAYYKNLA